MASFDAVSVATSIGSAIVGGLIVAFANHLMTRRRDFERKKSDLRISHLIESWKKIEKAANVGADISDAERNKRYDDLEDAVASINLLGSASEVKAANKFAVNLANGDNSEVTTLLNALRDGLRSELGLAPVEQMRLFMRMKRNPT